jgi:hypothetical protein
VREGGIMEGRNIGIQEWWNEIVRNGKEKH